MPTIFKILLFAITLTSLKGVSAENTEFELSIVTQSGHSEMRGHFYVLLRSLSSRSNSLVAYHSYSSPLRFEMIGADGSTNTALYRQHIENRPVKREMQIAPYKYLIFDIHYDDKQMWSGFPEIPGNPGAKSQTYKMRAVLSISKNDMVSTNNWTGTIASDYVNCVFIKPSSRPELNLLSDPNLDD